MSEYQAAYVEMAPGIQQAAEMQVRAQGLAEPGSDKPRPVLTAPAIQPDMFPTGKIEAEIALKQEVVRFFKVIEESRAAGLSVKMDLRYDTYKPEQSRASIVVR